MSKHEPKLEPKSPAKPDSITTDAELSEEQLKEVSGGFCGFFTGNSAGNAKPAEPASHGVLRKAGKGQLE